ncbi:MAG: hypothetical protein ABWY05_16215 [Noviherbaspirillum sp.]
MSNISAARRIFDAHDIEFISSGLSPIFYIRLGSLQSVVDLCHFLYGQGY